MMEGSVLMLLLVTGALAGRDLSGKVFLFPKETTTDYVILKPEVKKPLQRFSVCLRSYSELTRGHTLFSLATQDADNAILIFPETQNQYLLWINKQYERIKTGPSTLEWKHTCVTWDSATGVTQLWINGKPLPRKVLEKGFTMGADTSIILGQDQDSFGGGFGINDSFYGEISEVHMWDHVLTPEEIQKVIYEQHRGNLINWNSLNYETKGGVQVLSMLQGKWGTN